MVTSDTDLPDETCDGNPVHRVEIAASWPLQFIHMGLLFHLCLTMAGRRTGFVCVGAMWAEGDGKGRRDQEIVSRCVRGFHSFDQFIKPESKLIIAGSKARGFAYNHGRIEDMWRQQTAWEREADGTPNWGEHIAQSM